MTSWREGGAGRGQAGESGMPTAVIGPRRRRLLALTAAFSPPISALSVVQAAASVVTAVSAMTTAPAMARTTASTGDPSSSGASNSQSSNSDASTRDAWASHPTRRWRHNGILASLLSSPVGMAFDAAGRLLIANWGVGTVLAFAADGQASLIASGLDGPSGLAVSADGGLYVASYSRDLVWKIAGDGTKTVFATGLATPAGLAFDRRGRLLIANRRTRQILVADAGGRLTVAVEGDLQTPVGAVQLPDGHYAVSNLNGGVAWAGPDGKARTVSRDFIQPGPGIAIAGDDAVFVVDYGSTVVRQVDRTGRSWVVADGLSRPAGLVVTADGEWAAVADWGTDTATAFRTRPG